MSKKIVIDKEVFEQKIKGWIERRPYVTSKDFLSLIEGFITEIDIDQSIEERIKHYPTAVRVHVLQAMTEQDLISKAREKEFQDTLSTFETHHCGNSLTEKEIEYDHCLKCGEYLQED